ncbi:MAG TPA: cephalosporin hydroxylase family protein [Novosphingobium sp.]|nr:cephalosporin hydroxylase family protein [Novosphingobium sp.]
MPQTQFADERNDQIRTLGRDPSFLEASRKWLDRAQTLKYSYNFDWLGRPIIQYPQDIVVFQELVWRVQPDVIIETGIAHGGSLILSASLLAMLDLCDAASAGTTLDPARPPRKILGIDIDIRPHNRAAIEAHPLRNYLEMIEGSAVDDVVAEQVRKFADGKQRVLVSLDSNHTHDHVLRELELYAPLVTAGSYCVVYDTLIEDLSPESIGDRSWGKGDNPKTAVWEYLKAHPEFEIDKAIDHKLGVSVAPDGFLRRKG